MLIIIRYKFVIIQSLSVTTVWRTECADFILVLYYIPLRLKTKTFSMVETYQRFS